MICRDAKVVANAKGIAAGNWASREWDGLDLRLLICDLQFVIWKGSPPVMSPLLVEALESCECQSRPLINTLLQQGGSVPDALNRLSGLHRESETAEAVQASSTRAHPAKAGC